MKHILEVLSATARAYTYTSVRREKERNLHKLPTDLQQIIPSIMAEQAIEVLVAHSNLPEVCMKYKISYDFVQELVKNKSFKVVNRPVKVIADCPSGLWRTAIAGLTNTIATEIQMNVELKLLLAINASNRYDFARQIATALVDQLKLRYNNDHCALTRIFKRCKCCKV